jgi:hypothetical protein
MLDRSDGKNALGPDDMAEIAIITPSYADDFELCEDCSKSVLEYTPESTIHYIIVPRQDLSRFGRLRNSRTRVLSVDELLPQRIVHLPGSNMWINLRRPFPPVRGWVMQQIVKLLTAEILDADIIVSIDSDVTLVRAIRADTFLKGADIRFYCKEEAIDDRLPRHVTYHNVARTLLGLPSAHPPFPDYIHMPSVWARPTVLALQEHIQHVTGRHWIDAVASRLHVSECILYGVFVDDVLGGSEGIVRTDSMLCHNYYETKPLSLESACEFVRRISDEDFAIMISAKSRTPLDIRRIALSKGPWRET